LSSKIPNGTLPGHEFKVRVFRLPPLYITAVCPPALEAGDRMEVEKPKGMVGHTMKLHHFCEHKKEHLKQKMGHQFKFLKVDV
jgi:hypothetical protein